jgi:hypothetical protein
LDKWIALQVNLSGSRIEILVDGKSVLTLTMTRVLPSARAQLGCAPGIAT